MILFIPSVEVPSGLKYLMFFNGLWLHDDFDGWFESIDGVFSSNVFGFLDLQSRAIDSRKGLTNFVKSIFWTASPSVVTWNCNIVCCHLIFLIFLYSETKLWEIAAFKDPATLLGHRLKHLLEEEEDWRSIGWLNSCFIFRSWFSFCTQMQSQKNVMLLSSRTATPTLCILANACGIAVKTLLRQYTGDCGLWGCQIFDKLWSKECIHSFIPNLKSDEELYVAAKQKKYVQRDDWFSGSPLCVTDETLILRDRALFFPIMRWNYWGGCYWGRGSNHYKKVAVAQKSHPTMGGGGGGGDGGGGEVYFILSGGSWEYHVWDGEVSKSKS